MTTATTPATTTPARTYPPRPKPERISGMWLREMPRNPGKISMYFDDTETLRRFVCEADKPKSEGEVPDQWTIYVGSAGETGRGEKMTTVDAQLMNSANGGMFFAFTDRVEKRRYVCYENTLPPREGVTNPPDYSAHLDRSFSRTPFRPQPPRADDQAADQAGDQAGTAHDADPAGNIRNQQDDIAF